MKTLHLFAGIGGGILADIINGHMPSIAVEIDPYCCEVLRQRFPWMQIIEKDIRNVNFSGMVGIDAICGGFPCQDISPAGKGRGLSGEKSGLFFEVIRAIRAIRPQWVFLENSPAIRTRGRAEVVGAIVAEGYSYRDGTLAASNVGAPHQRNRWWLLARADSNRLWEQQPQGCIEELRGWLGDVGEEVPNTNGTRCSVWGSGGYEAAHTAIEGARSGDWWAVEPAVGRVVNGVPGRAHRIKGLGNAQVPLCAAVAWRLLGGPVGA